jgi:hypothetical protein
MNLSHLIKKVLERNGLLTDFATRSAIARDRASMPNQSPANPNAPLPGYGNLAPACAVQTWHTPLAQVQYAETRAARYDTRANRANAPPQ